MKYLLILFSLTFACSCKNIQRTMIKNETFQYEIEKIDSINNWYILNAKKNDTVYKIISKKINLANGKCEKIKIGEKYRFSLHSRNENPPTINGVKLRPQNYLDIRCYSFDEKTEICIEPEKGIYNLYFTKELQGLCYSMNITN